MNASTNTVQILSETSVFKGLTRESLNGLALLGEEKQFQGGDTIVRQYDRSQDLVVILEGRAQVRNFRGDQMAELTAGAVLGEISLLDSSPRSANVISIGTTRAIFLPARAIRGMMLQDPEVESKLLRNLSKLLCTRLRSMNALVESSRAIGRRAG